jgi:hypothetical protein
MPERRIDLLVPRTLTRRGARWAARIAHQVALRCRRGGAGLIGRLARWRPMLGGARRATHPRLTARVLRRRRTVRQSQTVLRLVRQVMQVRLAATAPLTVRPVRAGTARVNARPPADRPRIEADDPVSATATSFEPVAARVVQPPATGPVIETRLSHRTLRERVERLRLVRDRQVEQACVASAPSAASAAGPTASPRSQPPMVVHAPVARTAPAAHPTAPTAPNAPQWPSPIGFSPDNQGRQPRAVMDLDELVERLVRRIERRAVAQRERLGRS